MERLKVIIHLTLIAIFVVAVQANGKFIHFLSRDTSILQHPIKYDYKLFVKFMKNELWLKAPLDKIMNLKMMK